MGNAGRKGYRMPTRYFWIVVGFIFMMIIGLGFLYIGFSEPVDADIEVVGEIKDKQFDRGDFYFMMNVSGKISEYEVPVDVYYQHEVGEMVTVTVRDTSSNAPSLLIIPGVFMSMFGFMFIPVWRGYPMREGDIR